MVKLLALVPFLVSFGPGEYRIAQETPAAERVAPTPYSANAAVKTPPAENAEAAMRIRYAYAEISRLRAQLADATGRLEESRRNFSALDADAKERAAKITNAENRNGELHKQLIDQQSRIIAAVAAKNEAEAKVDELKNSANRAWVYCLLLGLACVSLVFYALSLYDSLQAIMVRLPEKSKDDQIAALQIELDKRANAVINLELLKEKYAAARAKSKRAGERVSKLLQLQRLSTQTALARINGLLGAIDRLAVQLNALRLADSIVYKDRIRVLEERLEGADLKLEARLEEIGRFVNFQAGSERTIERITLEGFEMLGRIALL